MSFGSRATQAKPEAQASCSERLLKIRFFIAGNRRFVFARARFWCSKNICAWTGSALVREPVLKLDRAGE
jgi:hypothetical protein